MMNVYLQIKKSIDFARFFIPLIIFLILTSSSVLGQIAIGTGTATQRYPLGKYFGYERSASIYTQAENIATALTACDALQDAKQ